MRILVIDDETQLITAIQRVLGGHDVLGAASGADALRMLADDGEGFDLILCDVMLPDLDGAQIYEQAIARTPEFEPRFLFMTGGPLTARTRAFVHKIARRCIDKPFDARTVINRVRDHASKLSTRRIRPARPRTGTAG